MPTNPNPVKSFITACSLALLLVAGGAALAAEPPAGKAAPAQGIAAKVLALTGAETRIVWLRNKQWETSKGGVDGGADVSIMAFDTGGKGERELVPEGDYYNPLISPDGRRVIYTATTDGKLRIHCVDWNGANSRVLSDGFAQWTWRDPATGIEWVYASNDRGGGDSVDRFQLDKPESRERMYTGRLTREALWVTDGVHPHDPGYREFAAAAWDGYLAAVKAGLAPRVPAQPVYADTYLTLRRFNLAGLPSLPRGWSKGRPNLTAVNHDWLMSRWLDDLIVARNRKPDEQGTPAKESQPVPPLRLKVEATAILLFGESTADSCRFRVLVDGVAVTGKGGQEKGADWFEGNRWKTGNGFLLWEVARGLDPSVPHLLEIEPVFDSAKAQELKLESIEPRSVKKSNFLSVFQEIPSDQTLELIACL